MREVAVIGIGMTKFGDRWESSLRDLAAEAGLLALKDAGVDHVDSIYVGNMAGGQFVGQEHLGSLVADYLGLTPVPATRIESACASGGIAFRQGFIEVASGLADLVLVIGVEKMTDVSADESTGILATAADQEYEALSGITFPGLYAMIATRHMHEYGTTIEQLSAVSVKNHRHASKNPNAQFPFPVTLEQVMQSAPVALPLRLLHCSPITDGAAAVVLCPADKARSYTPAPVKVIGSGQASDAIALHGRKHITTLAATVEAAKAAYKMAGIRPEDVDVAEVHDCFAIAEICITEDLGFVEKGKGGPAVADGLTDYGGKVVVNPSGGLKGKGHPVGATGVAQVCEIVEQLRGSAGERQVPNARIGLTQNMGGSGGSAVVHVFEVM
ncbi:MAG: thiolase domain-containing protein [Bacillota bacterium]